MSENPNPQENKEETKPEYNEQTAVLIKDLIIAIARTSDGQAIMSNFTSRQEMLNVMVNLNMEISGKIIVHDAKQRRSGIIQPKGGIVNFVRKGFKR